MKTYYNSEDLENFSKIGEFQNPLSNKFFEYYGEVFTDYALTAREKSLNALAVAHIIQRPYCIESYTTDSMEKGCQEEQMMEDDHLATAIRVGKSLVHATQMKNKVKETSM